MSNKRFIRREPIFLIAIGGVFLFGLIVMLLWNAILPDLLQISRISYWQAIGLLILSKILFGGFRFGGPGNSRWGKGGLRNLANMSPEEKERFKNEWRNRCNWRQESKTQEQGPAAE